MTSRKEKRSFVEATLVALLLFTGCVPQQGQFAIDSRYNVQTSNARLLFDLAHAHPQLPGGTLDKETYGYYEVSSWHSLLEILGRGGVSSDLLLEGKITRSLLEDYDLFCLFYPRLPAPPLTSQEMDALEEWVRGGGGLFIVGDHTNAGLSSERLNPLLRKFGMELTYSTVLDRENTYACTSWDKYIDILEHPITQGVRAAGVRATCSIEVKETHPDRPVGLIATSESAFLDSWDPGKPKDFTGDFVRQPDEPQGRFFVMAAATPGQGRVVVVGDHNIFDNVTLRYVDNLKLGVQAWNWLADENLDLPARERAKTILLTETTRPSNVMWPDSSRKAYGAQTFYTLFTALNRHPATVAHCTEFLDDDYSAVMVLPQTPRFAPPYLDYLKEQHGKGATIIVMTDPGMKLGEGTRQILREFDVSPGPVPEPGEKQKVKGELIVGASSAGFCTLEVYPWQAFGSETLVKFVTTEREYPVIVQYAPGIQIVLQAQIFRNFAFRTEDGYTLVRETVKPSENGLTVFRALWGWLDGL